MDELRVFAVGVCVLLGAIVYSVWIVSVLRSGERYRTIALTVLISVSTAAAVFNCGITFAESGWGGSSSALQRFFGWATALYLARTVARLEAPRPTGGKP